MIAWVLAAALLMTDPSGDTHGAGDLAPPTASVYESLGAFDLTGVEVLEGNPLRVRIALAAIGNPAELPLGVTLPIVEVYLDTDRETGEAALLPGSDMTMPEGHGWNVAMRVTGDEAYALRAEDGARTRHPVRVQRDGDALLVTTPFSAPERVRPYAITGVYDAFSENDWRPHSERSSPWAFSSPVPAVPVVDVLAPDGAAQREAVRSATLPPPSRGIRGTRWVVLMIVGVLVAGVGAVLRFVAPESAGAVAGAPESDAEADAPAGSGASADVVPAAPGLDVTWSDEHDGWLLREETAGDGAWGAPATAWPWDATRGTQVGPDGGKAPEGDADAETDVERR